MASTDFRTLIQQGWERASASYDEAWSDLMRPFAAHLVDAMDVTLGTRLLDLACGPGYVAEAAHALGAIATGVDYSKEMVRVARARNPGIEFREGDALALDFPDQSFDAAGMNFGLLHLADPHRAFREARRILRPGGCYGFTVWAEPQMSPGAAIIHQAIEEHGVSNPDLPDGPEFFAFGNPDDCREGLGRAGFDPDALSFRTVTVEWTVPTASYVLECERSAGVRTAAVLNVQSAEAQRAIEKQVIDSMQDFATEDGFKLPYVAHVVTVRRAP